MYHKMNRIRLRNNVFLKAINKYQRGVFVKISFYLKWVLIVLFTFTATRICTVVITDRSSADNTLSCSKKQCCPYQKSPSPETSHTETAKTMCMVEKNTPHHKTSIDNNILTYSYVLVFYGDNIFSTIKACFYTTATYCSNITAIFHSFTIPLRL